MNEIILGLSKVKLKKDAASSDNGLSALWLKIEKHKKRNANFSKKVSAIFEKFKQKALPYEQQQAGIIYQKVEHLISFISKKTLNESQLDELMNWIFSEVDYLESHPFATNIDVSSLRNIISKELSQRTKKANHTISEDDLIQLQNMLDEMFDGELQLERDELISILENPELLEKHIKNYCNNQESQHSDEKEFEEEFEHNYYHQNENFTHDSFEKNADLLEKLFKSSQLNKMYKRLASKLHPDKENDEDKKIFKHNLMQQLATARANQDVFTLLTLYQEYIDDDSITFDAETISAINYLLKEKISGLNYELRELKSSNTPDTIVWRHFNGRSQKIITQNIDRHVANLIDDIDETEQMIANTKTVKQLKAELNIRIKKQNESPFFNMDANLAELLNVPF